MGNPLLSSAAILGFFLFAPGRVLHAQAAKIFEASFGNDANDGSRGSPKRNFQPAHDAVAAGGQIVVLDTAGYGALAITKSVAVTVPPGVNGFVSVSGNADAITVNAGTSDVVSLRGLILEGGGKFGTGSHGVFATSVGTLVVEECAIRNFVTGISLFQSVAGSLEVHGSSVRQCLLGIFAAPQAVVALKSLVTGCLLEDNFSAALVTQSLRGGTVTLSAINCVLSGNNRAFQPSGSGTNSLIYADGCRAYNNTKVVDLSSGGQAYTLNNNAFTDNATVSDAFTGAVPVR